MSTRDILARCAVQFFAAGLLLFLAGSAKAALIVTAGSTIANAGSSAALDVTLTNTGPSAVTIEGFSFGLSTASPNITFTGATTSTSATYIFSGTSLFGPNINTSTGPALIASDIDSNFVGTTVGAGQTVGLGHVLFNVASGTPAGPVTVVVTPFPTTTLSDAMGQDIPIDQLVNGIITVAPSRQTVPEPSTLLLAVLSWPALSMLRQRVAA